MEELRLWAGPIAAAIAIANALYTFLTAGSAANTKRLDDAEADLKAHDRRIQKVEDQLEHLPDRDAAHRLELAIEKLNGRIETLDERLKPVSAISERMQELLLEQAKR